MYSGKTIVVVLALVLGLVMLMRLAGCVNKLQCKTRITRALTGMCGYTGWTVPLLFTCINFSLLLPDYTGVSVRLVISKLFKTRNPEESSALRAHADARWPGAYL